MSFTNLNDFLTSAPILALPIEGKDFTVYYDVFGVGFGRVLMQRAHVIVYASR